MERQGAHNTTTNPTRTHAGGREDCWSEGATETLIEAWGDRYVRLNRGNLRQKDWSEVADAVNSRQNGVKPPRTDIQCKNRIDTIKKKFKAEKSKPSPSTWPFFPRLSYLIGCPNAVTPSVKSKPKTNPNPNFNNSSGSNYNFNNSRGNNEKYEEEDEEDEDEDEDVLGGRKYNRMERVDKWEEDYVAYKELARAILRFGEVYERIESAKQHQMMELEKERMKFTKELECQRMNMFMEAQLELEKIKRARKRSGGSGKKL